jgi:hypothetical protein
MCSRRTTQACLYVNGRSNAVRCSVVASSPGPIVFTTVGGHPSFPCPDVTLTAGWNLIAGALAHNINTNLGPFYTYQTGDQGYEAVTAVQDAVDTDGYWVLFDQPTPVFDFDLARYGGCGGPPFTSPPEPLRAVLPPGQWVMLGNPFRAATVTGADVVLTYAAPQGYQTTQALGPGQGAWAYAAAGGTVTLTPVDNGQ